jgi:hypothetical protein
MDTSDIAISSILRQTGASDPPWGSPGARAAAARRIGRNEGDCVPGSMRLLRCATLRAGTEKDPHPNLAAAGGEQSQRDRNVPGAAQSDHGAAMQSRCLL